MRVPKRVGWKREIEILMRVCRKYSMMGVDRAALSAINPYCSKLAIPFLNCRKTVRDFSNELFHALGVLDEDSNIDFGEMTDYCKLDKDYEVGCYCATFNHHRIVGLRFGEDGYEYSVAAELGDLARPVRKEVCSWE